VFIWFRRDCICREVTRELRNFLTIGDNVILPCSFFFAQFNYERGDKERYVLIIQLFRSLKVYN
jgi:hypothetical protein